MIIPLTFSSNPCDLDKIEKYHKKLSYHGTLLNVSEYARGYLSPIGAKYRGQSADMRERNVLRFAVATNDGHLMIMCTRVHVETFQNRPVIKMPGLFTV